MEPSPPDHRDADPPDDPTSPAGKSGGRIKAGLNQAKGAKERARQVVDAKRDSIGALDATLEAVEHNQRVAGGLLASALAYRLFLWLLPLALLASVVLGFLHDGNGTEKDVVDHLGVSAYVTNVVSDASAQAHHSRWWMLAVALAALWSAGSAGSRALIALHQLAWGEPIAPAGKVWRSTLGFLAFTIAAVGATLIARWIRDQSGPLELAGIVSTMALTSALWFFATLVLPHRDAPWRALIPGALLVGVAAQLMHLVTTYYLAGKLQSSSELYGALGAAAAVLLWLFLVGYAIVAAAVLNATLWRRKTGFADAITGLAERWQPAARPAEDGDDHG